MLPVSHAKCMAVLYSQYWLLIQCCKITVSVFGNIDLSPPHCHEYFFRNIDQYCSFEGRVLCSAGERTFGVLTKLDLMDKGTDALDVSSCCSADGCIS